GGEVPEREAMTQVMKASDARQEWSSVRKQVAHGQKRFIVEQSGVPIAAIISAGDLERFSVLEAERDGHFEALDRIRAKNADKDPDEVLRDVTEVVEEVRQEAYEREQAAQGGR